VSFACAHHPWLRVLVICVPVPMPMGERSMVEGVPLCIAPRIASLASIVWYVAVFLSGTVFSEGIDPYNFDCRVWPRAAGFAGRLWSPGPPNATRFYPTLVAHRDRLEALGVGTWLGPRIPCKQCVPSASCCAPFATCVTLCPLCLMSTLSACWMQIAAAPLVALPSTPDVPWPANVTTQAAQCFEINQYVQRDLPPRRYVV
jgi:hypothetical protein